MSSKALAKSSKTLPAMVGCVVSGKAISRLQWVAAFGITLGTAGFSMSGKKGTDIHARVLQTPSDLAAVLQSERIPLKALQVENEFTLLIFHKEHLLRSLRRGSAFRRLLVGRLADLHGPHRHYSRVLTLFKPNSAEHEGKDQIYHIHS